MSLVVGTCLVPSYMKCRVSVGFVEIFQFLSFFYFESAEAESVAQLRIVLGLGESQMLNLAVVHQGSYL